MEEIVGFDEAMSNAGGQPSRILPSRRLRGRAIIATYGLVQFLGLGWEPILNLSTVEDPEATILARVIGQDEAKLPPAVAQEFLRWTFTEFDRQRMSELASKARAGTLTSQEQAETEGYERVSSFLGFVKSKARRSLEASSGE